MKLYFSFFLLLFCFLGKAQVVFTPVSLNDAFHKARREGKLIFLQFEAADCSRCNEVAQKGFDNPQLAAKMEQIFVCLQINAQHPEREKIAGTYNLNSTKSFGTLFLDDNGTLLHSYLRTTTNWKDYLKQIDQAFDKAGEALKITELEREYRGGNKSYGFLEVLLQKRKTLHLPTDSLLEEYVTVLPTDSMQSPAVIKFLAQMAPLPDSKADKVLRSNSALFNRVWYSMDLSMRTGINNTVTRKGMQKAIAEKNEAFALRTAKFAQSTNTNVLAGSKAFDMNMLRYYDEINDSTNYFRKSIAYYERYFLSFTPDSVQKLDSLQMKRMFTAAKKETVREGDRLKISTGIVYNPMGQQFCRELTHGASQFYKRTENPYLLSIATEWSKKALQFFESAEAMDTYARLLYKQGQKEEALAVLNKAIVLQEKRGFSVQNLKDSLDNMKKNAPLK